MNPAQTTSKPFNQRLHDFWFESAPATRVALLRIIVGAFALLYLLQDYDNFIRVARTDPRLFDPVGVVFGETPIGANMFEWILRATIFGGFCFTFGLWHRIMGPAFAVMALWVFCYRNSWSMIYHSDNLVVLHIIVLGFSRAADAFSLDAFFRGRQQAAAPTGWQYGWPVRLICAVTVCAYFVTAVAKLMGPLGLEWISGESLRSQMAIDAIRKELQGSSPNPVPYALYDWVPLFTILAIGSMAMEFFAPLALFNRRFGYFWAVNTFLMHWGILVVMNITFHYQLWGVMFLSFFHIERLLELPRKLWRHRSPQKPREVRSPEDSPGLARPSPSRATLYYDGECGLCDRFVQFVLRHDSREYFQFATLQSEAGQEQLARLGMSQTDLRTVVLAEEGESYERSTATLRVCRRLDGLWPLAYGFIVLPKRWRDAAYALVMRNRKRWFKASPECPVMPPHWRRRFIS